MVAQFIMPSLFALVTLAIPAAAKAQVSQGTDSLAWRCKQEFDESFHVLCIPQSANGTGKSRAPATAPSLLVTSREPRIPTEMMPVAQRGDAEVFSAEAWRVPLHAPPTDPENVSTLLESVLCGKRSDCSVRYEMPPQRLARR